MSPQSDLVLESKLETAISPAYTQHTFYKRGTSGRQWRIQVEERWVRRRRLGQGAYGVVWLEECDKPARRHGPRVRAVKEIQVDPTATEKIDYFQELEAVMKFSQERYTPSFVESYGWFEGPEAIYIAMEYVPFGDLQKHLAEPIPEEEAKMITGQLAEGLNHMHRNGFTHRDLKPGNILVVSKGPDWLVQISDFGISRRLRPEQATLGTLGRGTLGYIAPELLGFVDSREHPHSVDIWSLGAVIFRILTKKLFLTDLTQFQRYVLGEICFPSTELEEFGITPCLGGLLQQLLMPAPGERPSAESILAHEWLRFHHGTAGEEMTGRTTHTRAGSPVSEVSGSPYHGSEDEESDLDVASAAWSTLPEKTVAPLQERMEAPLRPTEHDSGVSFKEATIQPAEKGNDEAPVSSDSANVQVEPQNEDVGGLQTTVEDEPEDGLPEDGLKPIIQPASLPYRAATHSATHNYVYRRTSAENDGVMLPEALRGTSRGDVFDYVSEDKTPGYAHTPDKNSDSNNEYEPIRVRSHTYTFNGTSRLQKKDHAGGSEDDSSFAPLASQHSRNTLSRSSREDLDNASSSSKKSSAKPTSKKPPKKPISWHTPLSMLFSPSSSKSRSSKPNTKGSSRTSGSKSEGGQGDGKEKEAKAGSSSKQKSQNRSRSRRTASAPTPPEVEDLRRVKMHESMKFAAAYMDKARTIPPYTEGRARSESAPTNEQQNTTEVVGSLDGNH